MSAFVIFVWDFVHFWHSYGVGSFTYKWLRSWLVLISNKRLFKIRPGTKTMSETC